MRSISWNKGEEGQVRKHRRVVRSGEARKMGVVDKVDKESRLVKGYDVMRCMGGKLLNEAFDLRRPSIEFSRIDYDGPSRAGVRLSCKDGLSVDSCHLNFAISRKKTNNTKVRSLTVVAGALTRRSSGCHDHAGSSTFTNRGTEGVADQIFGFGWLGEDVYRIDD